MKSPLVKACKSIPISIFIAGNYDRAVSSARQYCDKVGLCVTVTKTNYVYTDGSEEGVIIGLINYPRFPKKEFDLLDHATAIGNKLLKDLGQKSFSIQTPHDTIWYSYRPEDMKEVV